MTFVIQATGAGGLAGTVERLRTGEKQHFRGVEALARLIEQSVRAALEETADDT
jgi:hypothetical protein